MSIGDKTIIYGLIQHRKWWQFWLPKSWERGPVAMVVTDEIVVTREQVEDADYVGDVRMLSARLGQAMKETAASMKGAS